MLDISERLKLCRKKKGKTQKDIALLLGVSERAYRHYELSDREPPLSTAAALADAFDVSLDYLVGRSDDPARR